MKKTWADSTLHRGAGFGGDDPVCRKQVVEGKFDRRGPVFQPGLCIGSRHEAPSPSSERSEESTGLTRRATEAPAKRTV